MCQTATAWSRRLTPQGPGSLVVSRQVCTGSHLDTRTTPSGISCSQGITLHPHGAKRLMSLVFTFFN